MKLNRNPLAGALFVAATLSLVHAEQPAAVSGVTGIKQDAVDRIKPVEPNTPPPPTSSTTQGVNKVIGIDTINGVKSAAPPPPPPPPNTSTTQGVNKVNGIDTINGVKSAAPPPPPPPPNTSTTQGVNKVNGIDTVNGVKSAAPPPPPPVQPPPPPPPTAPPPPPPTAVVTHVGSVATAAIKPITGVASLDAAKLRNLEAALKLKQDAETPAGNKQEQGGKGKAAAAALLAAPLEKAPAPLAPPKDGRGGFQEFEKLQNRGS